MPRVLRFALLIVLAAAVLSPAWAGKKKHPGEASADIAPQEVERTGVINRDGAPQTLQGPSLKDGDQAPKATLRDTSLNRREIDFADGTVRVMVIVPSLDTNVCSMQAREFNKRAAGMSEDVEVLVVSRDLPYAQQRFCAAQGIDRVTTLSDYATGDFGRSWGLYVKETALLARSVYVVDGKGTIRYSEIVSNQATQPKYDEPLAVVTKLAGAGNPG